LSFFVSWLFFATLYYIISYTHGDLLPEHLPANQSANGKTVKIFQSFPIFQLLPKYSGSQLYDHFGTEGN
jgi:hypothetical protein